MIGYLRIRVRKQPIAALYFELETVLKFRLDLTYFIVYKQRYSNFITSGPGNADSDFNQKYN